MKRFVILLFILLTAISLSTEYLGPVWKYKQFSPAEVRANWIADSSHFEISDASGHGALTYDSLISNNFGVNKKGTNTLEFNGTWGLFTKITTSAADTIAEGGAQTEIDTFYFRPRYYGGPGVGWMNGSIITLRAVDQDTSQLYIQLPTASGKQYYWRTSATDTLIQGNPYTLVSIVMYWLGDSTYAKVAQNIFTY